jgi:hypothetical protein
MMQVACSVCVFLTTYRKSKRCALVAKLHHLQSPAIVIAAFGFGVQKRDIVTLRIDVPRSTVFEHSVTMDRNQAQFM